MGKDKGEGGTLGRVPNSGPRWTEMSNSFLWVAGQPVKTFPRAEHTATQGSHLK